MGMAHAHVWYVHDAGKTLNVLILTWLNDGRSCSRWIDKLNESSRNVSKKNLQTTCVVLFDYNFYAIQIEEDYIFWIADGLHTLQRVVFSKIYFKNDTYAIFMLKNILVKRKKEFVFLKPIRFKYHKICITIRNQILCIHYSPTPCFISFSIVENLFAWFKYGRGYAKQITAHNTSKNTM